MLNYTINGLIRTQRPDFGLDAELHWTQLLTFVRIHLFAWLRGFKLLLFGFLPGKALLGRGVRLQYSRYIQLGQWIRLEDQVLLSALGRGLIRIGHCSRIGAYSRLITATSPGQLGSHIHIGNNVGIGEYAYLGGAGGLTIGDNCIIGQYFSCHPENHNYTDPTQLIRLQGVTRRGIHIGENCWIGAKVTILDGVHIGAGSVIAAGAVVTKNVPPQSVVGGVPARLLNSIS